MVTQLNPAQSNVAPPDEDRKPKWQVRDEQRRENKRLAEEAARARSGHRTISDRVATIRKRLERANVPDTINIIQAASNADRDLYVLVEKYGQNRKSVMRQFGAPRGSVEQRFIAEVGVGSPDDDPETGVEEE
jgi:hypothetical protein